jgi:hypothetical protein
VDEHCLFAEHDDAMAVAKMGLVMPWCFRDRIVKLFRTVSQWWTSHNSPEKDVEFIIVPVSSTILNLLRNGGSADPFPWDQDMDFNLLTAWPLKDPKGFFATNAKPLLDAGFQYEFRNFGERVKIFDELVEVDAFLSGSHVIPDYHLHATLLGEPIRLYPELLDEHFGYYQPGAKVYNPIAGAPAKPLHCRAPGHPACMPNCWPGHDGCEFEDSFVKLYTLPA